VSENNRLSAVRFGADGLVPVVTQKSRSGDILMLAYVHRDALDRTLSTGLAHNSHQSRVTSRGSSITFPRLATRDS
jgi:phosphoribosyl-ATP pyrophosphohydrolase/phosphoribosyl-AMP cyclohydrolase